MVNVVTDTSCNTFGGNSARKSYVVNNENQQNNEGCVF